MARFAVGHTVDIAARHYADIPSLRPLHEQTVADALEEVLAGPMILPPQDEDRLRGELASPDPDDGGISTALLNGEQDVWLASCGNFYSRSEEHTSELQSLMRISYAVFCLKKKKKQ